MYGLLRANSSPDRYFDLDRDSIEEVSRWIGDRCAWFGSLPTIREISDYAETVYHWQVMNTLIHDFRLQKYNGEYIFTYESWNHDIRGSYVFLEADFRKYLRLAWNNKIDKVKL